MLVPPSLVISASMIFNTPFSKEALMFTPFIALTNSSTVESFVILKVYSAPLASIFKAPALTPRVLSFVAPVAV